MRSVTVQELKAALDAGEVGAGELVDVREEWEFEQGRVPGARLVPMMSVPGVVDELPAGRPVFLVCAVGGRSGQAAQYLSRLGVDAVNVEGGTDEWVRAGFPVER
jgi:rhodanese-related sulfurtransferase